MGDRVRHTARLQCQDPKGVSNFKLNWVRTLVLALPFPSLGKCGEAIH